VEKVRILLEKPVAGGIPPAVPEGSSRRPELRCVELPQSTVLHAPEIGVGVFPEFGNGVAGISKQGTKKAWNGVLWETKG
jgi:hypothetical protein